MKGVYLISFSYEVPYIVDMAHSINQRIQVNSADIKHNRSCSSALPKHAQKTKHHVWLEHARIITREYNYEKRRIMEALEIMKHHHNLNMDGDIDINNNWFPLMRLLLPLIPYIT